MPSFAPALETTLHKALEAASSRRHEYATLEHLLLALIADEHASQVMEACHVNLGDLRQPSRIISTPSWTALKVDSDRPVADQRLPARRPARDPARAVVGPDEVTGANVLVALFPSAKATPSISCSSRI